VTTRVQRPTDALHLEEASRLALPLERGADLDPLLERIGQARFVLLGEASHGTSEFYDWRAAISRRLIEEHGFSFVAVEGDWPACYEVNRWVRGLDDDARSAVEVLTAAFRRWPTWMWANREVAEFATWLRERNRGRPPEGRAGFYGLDVYSLWESLHALLAYLEEHEPEAAEPARKALSCFEPYREDPERYARATRLVPHDCEQEVLDVLVALHGTLPVRLGDGEARFNAEQNALAAADAELYYRTMMVGGGTSWNVRDTHMAYTLDRLAGRHGPDSRAIVWAHNTHVGDARATDMADAGMVNIGQLTRERYGEEDVVLVGFGSYRGSVIAAPAWGATPERMTVPPALAASHEDLLHGLGRPRALLVFPQEQPPDGWLASRRPHRAIGVVYKPEEEPFRNYVPTVLGRRYDAFLHLEETRALDPLEPPEPPEPPEPLEPLEQLG
jgi:erythromycin esterase